MSFVPRSLAGRLNVFSIGAQRALHLKYRILSLFELRETNCETLAFECSTTDIFIFRSAIV